MAGIKNDVSLRSARAPVRGACANGPHQCCTKLKFCWLVVNGLGKEKIFTSNWLHEIHCGLERNKDVRMGVMNESVSGAPFLFHDYIPLHFIEMIFPLVPLIFHSSFFWGKAPSKIICFLCAACTYILCTNMRTRPLIPYRCS